MVHFSLQDHKKKNMVHFSFLFSLKPKDAEQGTKNKFELSLESHTSEHYSNTLTSEI
jgi:hypothetical protein